VRKFCTRLTRNIPPPPHPRPLLHSPCHCHFLPIDVKWLNSLMRANSSFAYSRLKYILPVMCSDNVLQLAPNLHNGTMRSNVHNRLGLFPPAALFLGLLLKLSWWNHCRLICVQTVSFLSLQEKAPLSGRRRRWL